MSTTHVRKTMRHDVAIKAAIKVAPAHADLVRLSNGSGAQSGWIDSDCVDASVGGMGFISTTFLPRMTNVAVRLFASADAPTAFIECPCVVRRVIMTDRRPAYHLGCSFGELTPELQRAVESFLNNLGGAE
jgi:c-di-GMP-binding flagellar brake protein YcgR